MRGGKQGARLMEIQVRSWLREQACRSQGAKTQDGLTLDALSDHQIRQWAELGFTHLWCMGVWKISEASRRQSIALHRAGKLRWPTVGVEESDVTGSPYAVLGYEVDPVLGGEPALSRLRSRLNREGMGLMLDYIPNHVGMDHPWVVRELDWFVRHRRERSGFFRSGDAGDLSGQPHSWVAHGKDPYYPPWVDTAQLDYRVAGLRRRMSEELVRVAGLCDALRIDMAMLVLSDVFEKTWREHPPMVSAAAGEFWHESLERLRAAHSDRLILGEVYWELETRLLEIGFDSVYDKEFYDGLVGHRGDQVQQHVLGMSDLLFWKGCRFLENHDEPRVAGLLDASEHDVAAGLMLGMPGVSLVHDGQMEGRRVPLDIRVRRRAVESEDAPLRDMYEGWLRRWKSWGWHDAVMKRLNVGAAWEGNPSHGAMVALQWVRDGGGGGERDVILFNLASHEGQARLIPAGGGDESDRGEDGWKWEWRMCEGKEEGATLHPEDEEGLRGKGRMISMPGYGYQRFRCVRR